MLVMTCLGRAMSGARFVGPCHVEQESKKHLKRGQGGGLVPDLVLDAKRLTILLVLY